MSDNLVCTGCGAPAAPASEVCPYCKKRLRASGALAGLSEASWEVLLTQGELRWGPPISLSLPATKNELIALRSRVLVDDARVDVDYSFEAGQGWEQGRVASAFGVSLRVASGAGYSATISTSGVLSLCRFSNRKLDSWLLEPSVHSLVKEGLGVVNRVGLSMHGDRLSLSVSDTLVATVRDGALRSGAVELFVRPGDASARVLISSLSVAQAT